MGTKERLEILKDKLEEKPKWWIINMEERPKVVENGHIYTEPPAETRLLASETVINELLKRISNLEFEVEERDRRIDKAIEYNKEVLTWHTNEEITDEIANENIRLLKGVDKE